MLTELTVTDLGVFAQARLVLGPGLTALTGETGAGKSLVVGAIELLLGGRADPSVVRPGALEAVIDGRFAAAPVGGAVADGLDDEVILSRVVPAAGRSRAYVDGRPVTVHALAERSAGLVELHGQHAHQQLLQARNQRHALDRFGGVDLGPLRAARARVRSLVEELEALGGDERARAREAGVLRFQLEELDAAELHDPDEDDALDAEETILADAVAHREAAARAGDALTGDGGAADAIGRTLSLLSSRVPFAEVAARLRSAVAEVTDAAADLRHAAEAISDDPERLEEIRRRRQLLADLRRKYGDTLGAVMEEREQIRARLADIDRHDERAAELDDALRIARAEEAAAAKAVAAARRAAAPALADGVQRRLRELAMPEARVEVAVEGDDPADDVGFLLAANPGGEPHPMARVASGGELSRATLALRLELTAGPPSLVFDEVDAGIGGTAAWAVGRALADLARRHQILVVTHLPQVAAFADQQVRVRKEVVRGRSGVASTTAVVEPLDPDARLEELARMLSGQPGSDLGRDHALELLEAAAGERAAGEPG